MDVKTLKERILTEPFVIIDIPRKRKHPLSICHEVERAKASGKRIHMLVELDSEGKTNVPNEFMRGMKHIGIVIEYRRGEYMSARRELQDRLSGAKPLYK